MPTVVLVDTDDLTPSKRGRVFKSGPEDGVVGGVPRNPESFGDPGDRQVLHHDAFQCPQGSLRRESLARGCAVLVPRHDPVVVTFRPV